MLGLIKKAIKKVRASYSNLRAHLVKKHTVKYVTETLMISHARELAQTPGEQWAVVRARQAQEIEAVSKGNLTITDRRSWQWPYLPESLSRVRQPIVKMTPYNIRRFAKSPVPRRAINLIKNAIISLEWDIVPVNGTLENADDDMKMRIASAKASFTHPNGQDSYQSFMEMGIDDMLTFGVFCVEPQITPDPSYPFKMWVVDSSTVRIFPTWRESDPNEPHYAQMTGLKGERGIIVFYDDELMYLRDNPSVETPFGLGKMEVAFNAVNAFLGVQEMSGRAGSDQIHKTWLWWSAAQAPQNTEIVRRHITNDIEGQAKVSIMSGMPKPDVLEIIPVQESDLLLNWQELLIRIIANAFDISAMALNLERDVNRSTGEVLDDRDFRSAVVPIAVKIAEGFTRFMLHKKLGWTDIKFEYVNMDDPDVETKVAIQQQLFAANANTPNEIRKALGMSPLATPWASLTQIEMIILQAEVTSKLADQNAQNASNRQSQMMDKQMSYQQQMQPSGGDSDSQDESKDGSSNSFDEGDFSQQSGAAGPTGKLMPLKAPKLKGLKPPKAPKLSAPKAPQLPMAGSKFTASEIAAMDPDELQQQQNQGNVPKSASQLKQSMTQQQPGILEQMSDELKDYLDQLEEIQNENDEDIDSQPTPAMILNQRKLFKQNQHKQSLMEKTVYNTNKDGIPKTRTDQDMFKRTPGSNRGKEVPNMVSDPRVSRKRPATKQPTLADRRKRGRDNDSR